MTGFGYKVVNEIRMCFEQWHKNQLNSTDNRRSISLRQAIPKILAHERAELVKLGNQLIFQEWKIAQEDFRDLIQEYQNKEGVSPQARKCCSCLDSTLIYLSKEEAALDFFCSTMKKVLIGILNKTREKRMQNRLLMNDEYCSENKSLGESILLEHNDDTYSVSSSPISSDHLSSSDDREKDLNQNAKLQSSPANKPETMNVAYPSSAGGIKLIHRKESSSDSSTNTSELTNGCSCVPKTEIPLNQMNEDVTLILSGFDIINKRLKRSVSTQTEQAPSLRSLFHGNSSKNRTKTTKKENPSIPAEEYDTLPRRLKVAIESQSLAKHQAISKDDSKCDTKSPFLCEELVEALKKIELVQLATKEGESLRGRKKFRRSHYFRRPRQITPTSSSSSSSYSSPCSSPARCYAFDSSFYSVFTISGNLPETADTNGKYSFKSYSVAHY